MVVTVTRIKNTVDLINNYKDNKHEFEMLKGVLCLYHKLEGEDRQTAKGLFDYVMIAERMDTLNRDAGSHLLKE